MRLPNRKYINQRKKEFDPYITEEKYNGLVIKLEKLKKAEMPKAAKYVAELATDGDFSENAGYQAAKHALRKINSDILRIENILKYAKVIKRNHSGKVEIGNIITVEVNSKRKEIQILGSSEADPQKNIISHNSPIGSSLIGKQIGDTASLKIKDKNIQYKIIDIK